MTHISFAKIREIRGSFFTVSRKRFAKLHRWFNADCAM
jgi:hypothetical protein